jgi:hypothetical protein
MKDMALLAPEISMCIDSFIFVGAHIMTEKNSINIVLAVSSDATQQCIKAAPTV